MTRTLTIGSRGDDVRAVQQILDDADYDPGPIDGVFGYLTQQAVEDFQFAQGLEPDGWVGPLTHAALASVVEPPQDIVLQRGDEGFRVKEWQAWLNVHGHRAGAADGVFGRKTARATKRAQAAAGLPTTGVVSSRTYLLFETWMVSKYQQVIPPPIGRGARGPDVRTLQGNLKLEGFDAGLVDGIFGVLTQTAVDAWRTTMTSNKRLDDPFDEWESLFGGQVFQFAQRFKDIETPYLSERSRKLAPIVVPWFHGDGDPEQAFKDRVHALHVLQGESGGHVLMNDIRWGHLTGGRPIGLFAVMTHLRWPTRLGLVASEADADMHHAGENARVAGALVYSRSSSWLGFHHWWSVGRHINPAIEALGLGIRVVWHCPKDPSYWSRVPAGSNFICDGVNYG